MTTRTLGRISLLLGSIIFLFSLLVDRIGLGDAHFGAGQLLGLETGVLVFLIGLYLSFRLPNKKIQFAWDLRSGFDRLLGVPISFWVLGSFFFFYYLFFIVPVFFDPRGVMWYFTDYLPQGHIVGLDNNSVLKYIHDWLILGQSPYFDNFILYPPLALILLAPLLVVGSPVSYHLLTMLTLLFHAIAFLPMLLVKRRDDRISLPLLLFILSMFSYGFQFELERGQFNVIAFSLCLVAIYLFHLNDVHRFPAYFLFTMGVQLKIYPVILIFMFIKDWRDWKGNIVRFAGLAFLNFSLLFIAGHQVFLDFLRSAGDRQVNATFWDWNHSLNAFVHQLSYDGFGLFSDEMLMLVAQYQDVIETVILISLGLCLLAVLIRSYARNSKGLNPFLLSICTILALVIPSTSNDYKLPLLTVPMVLLSSSIVLPERRPMRVLAIFLLLVISAAYWAVQFPLIVKTGLLSRNFPPLFMIALGTTILSFIIPWKFEETSSTTQ